MPKRPTNVSSLSAKRNDQADISARQFVACEARPVVVFDGLGDLGRLAVVTRVVAAHDALQLGKFADHVGQQVGLGEQGGPICLLPQGCSCGKAAVAIAFAIARTRVVRSPCVPSFA